MKERAKRNVEVAIHFEFGADSQARLSPAERQIFAAAFRRELACVRAWCAAQRWIPPSLPDIHVAVSDDFKISRALVPAWEGKRGRMEFPLWRVGAGKAAIAHELTHVFLPNGNRFLAEGLAIYIQSIIGGNPAFPNFGRSLHALAREHLAEMAAHFRTADKAVLDEIDLAELDATPTPNPLTLAVAQRAYAREPRRAAAIYAVAGSFLQFLIESYGLERFRVLYERTPLREGELDAGSPERWFDAYHASLGAIEGEWKSFIVDAVPNLRSA